MGEAIRWRRLGLKQRLYGHAEHVAKLLLAETQSLVNVDECEGLRSEAFVQERQQYLRAMHDVRRKLLDIVRPKAGPHPLPPWLHAHFRDVALDTRPDDDTLLKLVWERLCIVLAEDFNGARLVRGANRTLQLFEVVMDAEPSEATLKFLKRVSRCYVFGLDAECAILCRGAVDTAFANAVPDALLKRLKVEPAASFGYTLAQRIKTATDTGLIDYDEFQAAGRVNRTATGAAHEDPEGIADAFAVVRDALRVIRKLNPPA